jgi:hypothetical protein
MHLTTETPQLYFSEDCASSQDPTANMGNEDAQGQATNARFTHTHSLPSYLLNPAYRSTKSPDIYSMRRSNVSYIKPMAAN